MVDPTQIKVEVYPMYLDADTENLYRLYIDDELIIERLWVWPQTTYIREELWLNLLPRVDHNIRIEQVAGCKAKFAIRNFHTPGRNFNTSRLSYESKVIFILP
jgi:hypothetical protein